MLLNVVHSFSPSIFLECIPVVWNRISLLFPQEQVNVRSMYLRTKGRADEQERLFSVLLR